MLPFKSRRTSQPQGVGATVDKSSALGSLDWRLLFSGGGSVSGSANPTWPTPIGAGSVIGVGQAGRSIGINREKSGDYWSWGNNPQLKLDSMCGFCVFERGASATVVSSLFDTGITSDNNLGLGININADGGLHLNHQDHANLVITTSAPFKPGINVVAWRWDNVAGTGAIIYNGQKFTGATSPKTFTHGIASSCGYYSSPSGYANTACGIYMLGISSNGDIADSTLSRLHNEYLSLFKPQSRSLWIPGTVSGGGAATVIPIGQQATGSVGTLVATGAAKGFPAGVSASSAVGTPAAVGGASIPATVLPAGVSATVSVGTATATGQAKAYPSGVSATVSFGSPVALAGGAAVATPAGVQAVGAVGNLIATGAAWVVPGGVSASGAVGTPVATVPGAAVYPTEAQVQFGVVYGPTGIEFTGTLTGGSGPSAADIAAAVIAAAQVTPIWADARWIKGQAINGSGTEVDPWGP